MSEAARIAKALGGRRSGNGWVCRCPAHDDRSPSLSLHDGEHAVVLKCFANCDPRLVLGALRHAGLLDDRRQDAPRPPPERRQTRPAVAPPLRWSSRADATWQRAGPIASTIAEDYLLHRGCAVPTDGDLRFLAADDRHQHPALVARITDFATGEPLSLHFTFLNPDGSGKAAIERPRLLLAGHQKAGGVIRLTDDADVTTGLGLAEGIETALSVTASGWSPVWAAIDAGNLSALPVVDGIESVTIFADHDPAGIKGAEKLAQRWREAAIVMPKVTKTDWNDAAQEGRTYA